MMLIKEMVEHGIQHGSGIILLLLSMRIMHANSEAYLLLKFNIKANNINQLKLLVEITLYYLTRHNLTFVLYTKKHTMVHNLYFLHINVSYFKTLIYLLCRSGSSWLWVTPFGLRKMLNWIAKTYNNMPVYVTENGISDRNGSLFDEHRVHYYRTYINEMLKGKNNTRISSLLYSNTCLN